MWLQLFKNWLKLGLKAVLQWIPRSFILAFLAWFFTVVIGSTDINLLSIWKWAYLLTLMIVLISNSFATFITGLSISSQAAKWNMPPRELLEAMLDLKVYEFLNMTPSEFYELSEQEAKDQIAKCKTIDSITKAFAKTISDIFKGRI